MSVVVSSGVLRNDETASPMFNNGDFDFEDHRTTMQINLIRLHMQTMIIIPNAGLLAMISISSLQMNYVQKSNVHRSPIYSLRQ